MQNEITPTAVDRRPSARTLIIRLIFFATCLAAGALLFYAIETRELSSRRQHFEHMVDKLKARFNLSDENVTFILSEVEKSKSICYPGESLLDFLFLASTVVTTIGKLITPYVYTRLTICGIWFPIERHFWLDLAVLNQVWEISLIKALAKRNRRNLCMSKQVCYCGCCG